jgi:ADP-ribosylglycohydrolase
MRDRIRGCLLGGAVGDALGAPIEGASLAEIRARFGPEGVRDFAPGRVRPGAITDDTQMTLFTAEGLVLAVRDGAFPQRSAIVRSVHRAYLRWLRTQGERSRHPTFERTREGWLLGIAALNEWRGPGATCLSALRSGRMSRIEQPLNTSKGCGGVMRIAPVGLALAIDEPFRLGCEIAALTHGHPSGYLAAGFQAFLVRELLLGAPLEAASAEGLEELRRWPGGRRGGAGARPRGSAHAGGGGGAGRGLGGGGGPGHRPLLRARRSGLRQRCPARREPRR